MELFTETASGLIVYGCGPFRIMKGKARHELGRLRIQAGQDQRAGKMPARMLRLRWATPLHRWA